MQSPASLPMQSCIRNTSCHQFLINELRKPLRARLKQPRIRAASPAAVSTQPNPYNAKEAHKTQMIFGPLFLIHLCTLCFFVAYFAFFRGFASRHGSMTESVVSARSDLSLKLLAC